MTESRSRRFISTLALIIALLIAVGLPAAYGLIRGAHETEMLSLRARMNAAKRTHPPEFIAAARALWTDGHSAAEIGRRMGVTKNVVIGMW